MISTGRYLFAKIIISKGHKISTKIRGTSALARAMRGGKNDLRHYCTSGPGGSVNNWPPRYGSVILKLDPNFGIGRITESRGKMICGIVVHPDPVDLLKVPSHQIRLA